MTREVWRARIVTDEDDYYHHELIEKPTLEELLDAIREHLPKKKPSGKVDAYDIEKDDCVIEHVVILDEISIDKAVTIINAKAHIDKELMARVNEYEALKKAVNDMSWKQRTHKTKMDKLRDSIRSSESTIGNCITNNEEGSKYYQKAVAKGKADKVKWKELCDEERTLDKEYNKLYAKKEKMRKELGV